MNTLQSGAGSKVKAIFLVVSASIYLFAHILPMWVEYLWPF